MYVYVGNWLYIHLHSTVQFLMTIQCSWTTFLKHTAMTWTKAESVSKDHQWLDFKLHDDLKFDYASRSRMCIWLVWLVRNACLVFFQIFFSFKRSIL